MSKDEPHSNRMHGTHAHNCMHTHTFSVNHTGLLPFPLKCAMAMESFLVHFTSPSAKQYHLVLVMLAMNQVSVRQAQMVTGTVLGTVWDSLTLSSPNFMRVSFDHHLPWLCLCSVQERLSRH